MKIINGLLDYSKPWSTPDLYLFTGNRYITAKGKLVMGRGAALQCRDTYPGVDKDLANYIKNKSNTLQPNYFIIFTQLSKDQYLGAFQVKNNFADKAELEIIKRSTKMLKRYAIDKPHLNFHMNFPGIGYGGLPYELILPIVQQLPDNVILYK